MDDRAAKTVYKVRENYTFGVNKFTHLLEVLIGVLGLDLSFTGVYSTDGDESIQEAGGSVMP